MDKIILENIRVYSNHGCLEEESLIGSDYLIDLEVEADLSQATQSDQLNETIDYVLLNSIVKEEMLERSKLLEHVAKRILDRIGNELPQVSKAQVKVSKLNPPIGGNVQKVSVVMNRRF